MTFFFFFNSKDLDRVGQASGVNMGWNHGLDTIRANVVPVDERHVAGEISTSAWDECRAWFGSPDRSATHGGT